MNNAGYSYLKRATMFLPVWIWIIVAIEIVVPFIGATSVLVDPSFLTPGASELTNLSCMFIVRNYAAAFGVIVALFLWDYKALFAVMAIRIFMDIGDMCTMIAFDGLNEVWTMILFMLVALIFVPGMVLRFLWTRIEYD